MEIIDPLSKLIDIINNPSQLSEEAKLLQITCNTLLDVIKSVKTEQLPENLVQNLKSNLTEATLLLKDSEVELQKLKEGVLTLLPNSKLSQIKEKCQKLVHLSNMIQIHLQCVSNKKQKQAGLQPTLDLNLPMTIDNHILSDSDDDSIELILYTNQDNLTIFEKNKKCDAIKIKVDHQVNDQQIYSFERIYYQFLPDNVNQLVSRQHAIIEMKKEKKSFSQKSEQNQCDQQNEEIFATCVQHEEDKNMCEFFVTDKSTNGTFILHKNNILDKESIMNNNKWIKLIKNKQTPVENGDVIGLIMNKQNPKNLILGYKLFINRQFNF